MVAPSWLGATSGQLPASGQVNQFLVTHPATVVYTGAQQGGQTTLGSGSTTTNGLYLAQQFTAGSTFGLGRIVVWMSVTGSPAPTTFSIRTSSGGVPTATVLSSTAVPAQYPTGTAAAVSVPLPCSLASGTGYWIVASAAGDASDFFSWFRSNQTSLASTSANGTSWTAQTYGFYYSYWDQSAVMPLAHTWEDSGARWTAWQSSASIPTGLEEYTVAQGTGQYVYSGRSIGYVTPNVPTTIS